MAEQGRIAVKACNAGPIVDLSRATIYRLIASGTLPSHKVQGSRMVLITDLERLVSGEPVAS